MIAEIEPGTVAASPDLDSGGIVLEVVDPSGNGFRTLLDFDAALDLVRRSAASAGCADSEICPNDPAR
jgi:hypothetical protein